MNKADKKLLQKNLIKIVALQTAMSLHEITEPDFDYYELFMQDAIIKNNISFENQTAKFQFERMVAHQMRQEAPKIYDKIFPDVIYT